MTTADGKPCFYAYAGCTWKTPDHDPTTRVKIEANMRNHASECPHKPTVRENRRRAQNWDAANKRTLAEAELRRRNARKEEAAKRRANQEEPQRPGNP